MNEHWTEDDSRLFIDEGAYYVPERELQIRVICDLIPATDGPVDLLELCPGEGLTTRALLERFPEARVHAFDGSPAMLESTRARAGAHAGRLTTRAFDLAAEGWRDPEMGCHGIVSSLAVHHLDGPGKRDLFADLYRMLAPGGVFVLADLTEPPRSEGTRVAADSWDEAVKERAQALDGSLEAFARFQADDWNYYRLPGPDPIDKPSALFDQLKWLEAAGFAAVDVHWMKAGHAIMSGIRLG